MALKPRKPPPRMKLATIWNRIHSTEIESIGDVRDRIGSALRKELKVLTQDFEAMEQLPNVPDHAFDWYIDEGHIRTSVIPDTLGHTFTAAYWSQLEYAVQGLSQMLHKSQGVTIPKKPGNESFVGHYLTYVEGVGGFTVSRTTDPWLSIEFYRALRNHLAHEGPSHVPEKLAKAISSRKDIATKMHGQRRVLVYGDDFLDNMQAVLLEFIMTVGKACPL